jgi:hypothetical protein
MDPITTFRSKAPGIVATLLGDFPWSPADAFAAAGNAGYECLGFTQLQELKPVVAGSRGGWGWMQWTGPRRRAFEAYCKRNSLDPAGDQANYAWLFIELKGAERQAIAATSEATTLDGKVKAFERTFLRAGVKNYPGRLAWAERAMIAWREAGSPRTATPTAEKVEILTDESDASGARAARNGAGAMVGAGGEVMVVQQADRLGDLVTLGLGGVLLAAVVWLGWLAIEQSRRSRALAVAAAKMGPSEGQPFGGSA